MLRPCTQTSEEGSGEQHLPTMLTPDALVKEVKARRAEVPQAETIEAQMRKIAREQGVEKMKKLTSRSRCVKNDCFIFTNADGGFMNKENILFRVFTPIREKLTLPVLNFQVLRRTASTLRRAKGASRTYRLNCGTRKRTRPRTCTYSRFQRAHGRW